MDVIVGFGPLHDTLLAAALRGCGVAAQPGPAPGPEALALGRRRMARGHPCSVYYLAGCLTAYARAHAPDLASTRFVVPGDRCGGYAADLARALAEAGFPAAVVALAPERSASLGSALGLDSARAWALLAEAVAVGDVLDAVGMRLRAMGRDPATTHARIAAACADAADTLARGLRATGALQQRRAALRPHRGAASPRQRVRLTGELLPTRYHAEVAPGLVSWMEDRGVAVEATGLCEWVLYAAWRGALEASAFAALRQALGSARARCAAALGFVPPPPVDVTAWIDEAARWLPVSLCAGSGILEVATYLSVDADRRADLVVSLKPFASITSSAASDAVLHVLSRSRPTAFLALELNGDLSSQLESRLELALHAAHPAFYSP